VLHFAASRGERFYKAEVKSLPDKFVRSGPYGRENIPAELVDRIRSHNILDVVIHEYALQRFNNDVEIFEVR